MKYFPRQNGLVESYVGEVKRVMKKWGIRQAGRVLSQPFRWA